MYHLFQLSNKAVKYSNIFDIAMLCPDSKPAKITHKDYGQGDQWYFLVLTPGS